MPEITVALPTADRRLCSLQALKIALGIAAVDPLHDDWLLTECLSASDLVSVACGVVGDDAGAAPATFREETATVAFAPAEINDDVLFLPWRFPARVTAVLVDGVASDLSSFAVDQKAALLFATSNSGASRRWRALPTSVTVASGWPLDRVPTQIQDAVKRLVRLRWEGRDRDLALKAVSVEGAVREEYWVGGTGAGGSGIPGDVMAALKAGAFFAPAVG